MRRCARCDWHPDLSGVDLTQHALDAGHPLCPCCSQSLTLTDPRMCCESCLTDARSTLSGIVTMYAELPAHLRTIAGPAWSGGARGRADASHMALPGGPVLSLLGPGSPGGAARRLTTSDVERGLDGREHRADNCEDDTPSVAWTLAQWHEDWVHTRGEPAPMTGTTTAALVREAARYLEVHARWAANSHPAFDEYLSDLKGLHARLETATHRRRRPTRANADCFECGSPLWKLVDPETGIEDEVWTCRICDEEYDDTRYNLALAQAAEAASRFSLDGIAWATPQALAVEFGRSEHTIRSWAQRRQVASHVRAGVLFVDVDGVRQLVEAKGRTA